MKRTEVLKTANTYVTKDRAADHGDPEDTFSLIARLWSEYLDHQVSEVDVAMLMTLLKIARQRGNPQHQDNYVDGCGYLALAAAELATVSSDVPPEPSPQVQAALDDLTRPTVPPNNPPAVVTRTAGPEEVSWPLATQWESNISGGL